MTSSHFACKMYSCNERMCVAVQIDNNLVSVKVAAVLRWEILYGKLKPHKELYQDKIAQELGVSRMPVREALQILANDGFVTVRPNRVAIVNDISEKFVRDFYDVRVLLECAAIRIACQKQPDCSPAWVAYDAALRCIQREDPNGFNVQNERIHRFIWEAADNLKLTQIMSQMWHTLEVASNPYEEMCTSNQEHYLLIRCIEQNDPETAVQTLELHIGRSCKKVLKHLADEHTASKTE